MNTVCTRARPRHARLMALAILLFPGVGTANDWLIGETNEFIVIGDARKAEISRVLEGIQVYRYVAGKFYPSLLKPAPYKARIFVLRHGTFTRYLRQREHVVGLVLPSDFAVDMVVESNNDDDWMGNRVIVQHELTKFYMQLNFRGYLPAWFDEGLAEFFSTIDFKGKRARIGVVPPARDYTLQTSEWMPLQKIFAADRKPTENKGDRAAAFSAQSWLLVHYALMSKDPKVMGYYQRMFRGLEIDMDLPLILEQVFAGQFADFERQVRQYGATTSKLYGYFETPPEALQLPELKKLDSAAAAAELADIVLRLSNRNDAELDADIGALLPGTPSAHEAGTRALAYLANKSLAAAEPLLEACKSGANDYRSLLMCARAWEARTEFPVAGNDRVALQRTVLDLSKRALAINSEGFAALYKIMDMNARLGNYDKEVLLLAEQALLKIPSSFSLRMALSYAYASAGNLDAAKRHLDYALLNERDLGRRGEALRRLRALENDIAEREK